MQQAPDNRRKAITFTVLLHIFLVASVILGIEFSDYRPLSGPKVDIVEAELVTTPPKPRVDPEIERQKREAEERQRQAEAEAQRKREAEERKQAEALAQQKAAEEARRQAEREAQQKARAEAESKRKAEEAARKKAEAEARKQAELEAQRKARAEAEARRMAAEEAARKEAEEEARRQAEAERQAREQAMLEAAAAEERERQLRPLQERYIAAISQKISRNWLKPPGISDDLKCEALVIQMPDGNVSSAKITKSSGNSVFDESVIKAIYKAAPLPQPPSPEVFDRELQIAFCSTGNLC